MRSKEASGATTERRVTNGFEVVVGPSALLKNAAKIAAESVQLNNGTTANDVFYVDKYFFGNGATGTPKVGFVPLFFGMPVVPSFTAGGTDVNLQNGQSLGPGTYGCE